MTVFCVFYYALFFRFWRLWQPLLRMMQDLSYPGRRREIKQQIVEMTLNGSGVRDIARVLYVSTATVIQELKKNSPIAKRQSEVVEPTATRPSRGSS
jgi:DNA invertase Pin-like site-specific DNA recombinase